MKVLYADDDIQMRDYVSMLIEATFDCEILESSSGNEALSILSFESDIDFVLFEVKMNGGDGHLILDYLDEHSIDVPVVLLSKTLDESDPFIASVLKRHSCNVLIKKPFKDNDFFPALEAVVNYVEKENKSLGQGASESKDKVEGLESTTQKSTLGADWGSEKKAKQADQEADWGSEKKAKQADQEADWGSEKKAKQADLEADWGSEKKAKQADQEADWGSEKKAKQAEEEADWGSEKKAKQAEEEADWGSEKKAKQAEEEADWGSERKAKQADQEADWVSEKKVKQAEEEADWGSEKKAKQANLQDELVAKNKVKQESDDYNQERFNRVSIKRFMNFDRVCCDAYIKLSSEKYVKLLATDEVYDIDLLDRYQDKNVRHLYIEKKDYQAFSNQFSNLVFTKLKQVKNMPTEVKMVAELTAFDTVLNKAKDFGVTDTVAEQVKESIDSVLSTLSSLPGLDGILSKIMKGGSYVSEHSLLLSYVAGQISTKTPWASESVLQKLSMAALFHDAGIDSDELARIHDLKEAKSKGLSKEEIQMIKEHPQKAADLINSGKSIFPDVDTIIMQHHESPDQTGYPKGLGALSISPLACTFIIASDFVEELLDDSVDFNLEQVKVKFKEKFNRGNFKKPLEAFLEAF